MSKVRGQVKKLLSIVMTAMLVVSMTSITAFASGTKGASGTTGDAANGTITLNGATIGETYHVYKLFDVTYGEHLDDGTIPTSYIATADQKAALENADGNKFNFAPLSDSKYQVTVMKDEKGNTLSDAEVIAFLSTFCHTLSGNVQKCNFPGATEVSGSSNTGIDESKAATESTVVWKNVPAGYYFVTSSLGSVVTIDTTNPNAAINDKNTPGPDWDNEPDDPNPDEPVKDVQNESGQSIDGNLVDVDDVLTYEISYTNNAKDGEGNPVDLDSVTITDAVPTGTTYVGGSAWGLMTKAPAMGDTLDDSFGIVIGNDPTDNRSEGTNGKDPNGSNESGSGSSDNGSVGDPDADDSLKPGVSVKVAENGITWNFTCVPAGATVVAYFQVKVTEAAQKIPDKTIVNDADVKVKIGENEYDLKTNKVTNPVYDPDDPVKDVLDEDGESIDGERVEVGDILTYEISYKNTETEKDENDKDVGITLDSVTITDAAPTGTTYVADSAAGYRDTVIDGVTVDENGKNVYEGVDIEIGADGAITWTFENVGVNETVIARFQVKVTEAALSISDKTVVNTGDVSLNDKPAIKTNKVTNPTGDEPDDPNPGKVIVNADGTESTVSTGNYGDTVNFSIGINAVNKVTEDDGSIVQVKNYYIYDKLAVGFSLDKLSRIFINGLPYDFNDPSTYKNDSGEETNVNVWEAKDNDGKVVATFYTSQVTEPKGEGEEASSETYTLIMGTIPWVSSDGKALYPNCKIDLRYSATINDEAVIAGSGNLNTSRYDYSTTSDTNPKEPDPENPKYPEGSDLNHGSDEKSTTTYTYALGVYKLSAETGEALEGATFTLKDAYGNEIKAVENNDGTYSYSADRNEFSGFVSGEDGKIIIKGVDAGTYFLTEVKAPDGYNLLAEPVEVEAKMDSESTKYNKTEWTVNRSFEAIAMDEFFQQIAEDESSDGARYVVNDNGQYVEAGQDAVAPFFKFVPYDGDMYTLTEVTNDDGTTANEFTLVKEGPDSYDALKAAYEKKSYFYKLTGTQQTEGNVTEGTTTISFDINTALVEVKNSAGSLLPSTGGMGTAMLYIVGGLLIVGAGVGLVIRRRMNSAE